MGGKVNEQQFSMFDKGIAERFQIFHRDNPHIYQRIVDIAFEMRQRGVKKMGIALIFERLRWLNFIEVNTDEGFRTSSRYASSGGSDEHRSPARRHAGRERGVGGIHYSRPVLRLR